MENKFLYSGFTLVELMVTVALVSILTAIAVPAYNGYIETSAAATTMKNAQTLAGFEDTYFYENETYLAGAYDPPGANGLAALGWSPTGDNDLYTYVVTAGTTTDITTSYAVTVTYKPNTTITALIERP